MHLSGAPEIELVVDLSNEAFADGAESIGAFPAEGTTGSLHTYNKVR
jgi:hypothetical protein